MIPIHCKQLPSYISNKKKSLELENLAHKKTKQIIKKKQGKYIKI